MNRILLLGCGTQGLSFARSLKANKNFVVLVGKKNNYADASRYLDKFIKTDLRTSSPFYLELVLSIINDYRIETIIPMGDVYSEFLSKNKETLLGVTHFLMPDYVVWERGVNKSELMKLCKEKGYPHPYTFNTIEEVSAATNDVNPFPLLIKPNITCGGRGMTLVNSFSELMEKYPAIKEEYGDCHFQKYVKQGGAQVEFQLFVDENKNLVNSSVIYKYRWYPEKGGSSCCAVSSRNDKMVAILFDLLKNLGWVGFADFDTIEDPDTGELLIMELNPRVPACVKCVVEAGMNWGQIITDGYLGNPQKEYNYKTGEYLRHLGFEVLWFLKSHNRFRTQPNWFKFFGKHIHYQDMSDWTDPLPFITGSMSHFIKVLGKKEKDKIER